MTWRDYNDYGMVQPEWGRGIAAPWRADRWRGSISFVGRRWREVAPRRERFCHKGVMINGIGSGGTRIIFCIRGWTEAAHVLVWLSARRLEASGAGSDGCGHMRCSTKSVGAAHCSAMRGRAGQRSAQRCSAMQQHARASDAWQCSKASRAAVHCTMYCSARQCKRSHHPRRWNVAVWHAVQAKIWPACACLRHD